jgi:hypothetical protein
VVASPSLLPVEGGKVVVGTSVGAAVVVAVAVEAMVLLQFASSEPSAQSGLPPSHRHFSGRHSSPVAHCHFPSPQPQGVVVDGGLVLPVVVLSVIVVPVVVDVVQSSSSEPSLQSWSPSHTHVSRMHAFPVAHCTNSALQLNSVLVVAVVEEDVVEVVVDGGKVSCSVVVCFLVAIVVVVAPNLQDYVRKAPHAE